MTQNESSDRENVSKLSRRGLLALGATLAGLGGLGTLSETASAHGLMAFRDAFVGNDADKTGLGSKGWLFFAKDTGTVYYHDGSSWQPLGIGGQLSDTDGDGLLEAPNHDGIDVGTLETDEIHLGADQDGDGSEWRFDADSSDTARIYSWDGSAATEHLRLNEDGPVEVKNADLQMNGNPIRMGGGGNNIYGLSAIKAVDDSLGSDFLIRSRGDGSSRIALRDEANTQDLLVVNEGGPVEVRHSNFNLNGNDVNNVGTLNASTKNFVQDIGHGKEAVYTAQESPDVRAVVEGSVEVGPDGATISLPEHFDAVTSDENPDVTVQATPDELTQVACTSRSTAELEFETAEPCEVDYRVTAIREGHEDKQVVRDAEVEQTSQDQERTIEPDS